MLKPHNYQNRAIDFAVYKGSSYQMIDMGMGKTMIALKAIQQVNIPAFVFAPLWPALTTWPDEIQKWTPNLNYTILHGNNKNTKIRLNRNIYILNYDGLKWFYNQCVKGNFKLRKFFMVFDESTYFKDHSTKRFKMMQGLSRMYSPWRMNLSGTPAANGLHQLWSQYYVLDNGQRLKKHYTPFRDEYFHYFPKPHFKTVIKQEKKHDLYRAISDITFRLKASDYLNLPPLMFNDIRISLPPNIRKLYEKVKKEKVIELGDQPVVLNEAMLTNKLRQITQGGLYTKRSSAEYKLLHNTKCAALKDLVDYSSGQPVLAAVNFRFEYDMICKYFKKQIPIVAGITSSRQAHLYIKQWNHGRLPLLLVHPGSVGHGMNIQSGGHIIVWYGVTFHLDHYQQLNARLHRQGQKNAVIVHNLSMVNTIDERIFNVLKQKDATQTDLLNAMRHSQ